MVEIGSISVERSTTTGQPTRGTPVVGVGDGTTPTSQMPALLEVVSTRAGNNPRVPTGHAWTSTQGKTLNTHVTSLRLVCRHKGEIPSIPPRPHVGASSGHLVNQEVKVLSGTQTTTCGINRVEFDSLATLVKGITTPKLSEFELDRE
uniref:Uncharacterized protein n=1 Tax=Cannabis sativa TaxID=3483 RepID=A0A803PQ67_CANSA